MDSVRLQGLIDSCDVQDGIYWAPSSVTFRFGNSGTLRNTFAAFSHGKQMAGSEWKWCRVEHRSSRQTQCYHRFEQLLTLSQGGCGSRVLKDAFLSKHVVEPFVCRIFKPVEYGHG